MICFFVVWWPFSLFDSISRYTCLLAIIVSSYYWVPFVMVGGKLPCPIGGHDGCNSGGVKGFLRNTSLIISALIILVWRVPSFIIKIALRETLVCSRR